MLAVFSGRIIYIFGIPERLRTLRYAIFTGGVVKATGICSACFLRKYGANPLSHRCTMPDSPFCRCATSSPGRGKSFLSGGALFVLTGRWQKAPSPRNLANGVSLRGLAPSLWESWQSRQTLTERARTVVLRPCFLLYMYKSDRTAHTKHCATGAAEFSTGRKAYGLCILHRKCAL